MSDIEIGDILARENLKIARRTVAKYRKQLKILPSHIRKRRFAMEGNAMNVHFTARQTDLTPEVRQYCEKRLKALEKLLGSVLEVDIILSVAKTRHRAEIHVMAKGAGLVVVEETPDMIELPEPGLRQPGDEDPEGAGEVPGTEAPERPRAEGPRPARRGGGARAPDPPEPELFAEAHVRGRGGRSSST